MIKNALIPLNVHINLLFFFFLVFTPSKYRVAKYKLKKKFSSKKYLTFLGKFYLEKWYKNTVVKNFRVFVRLLGSCRPLSF